MFVAAAETYTVSLVSSTIKAESVGAMVVSVVADSVAKMALS